MSGQEIRPNEMLRKVVADTVKKSKSFHRIKFESIFMSFFQ